MKADLITALSEDGQLSIFFWCSWRRFWFEFYNNFIDNYKEGPLLIIDADKNKFAENEEHLGQIITSIDSKLFGLF